MSVTVQIDELRMNMYEVCISQISPRTGMTQERTIYRVYQAKHCHNGRNEKALSKVPTGAERYPRSGLKVENAYAPVL